MKLTSVTANNRRRAFEVSTERAVMQMPYAKVVPAPSASDPLREVYVDPELGCEGFTWLLASGAEGSLHVESVLEYNRDPGYLRDLLVYRLTLEAIRAVEACGLSKREVIRRARTSPAQFYRLLDPTNYSKSVDSMISLLAALDCDVDIQVREKTSEAG